MERPSADPSHGLFAQTTRTIADIRAVFLGGALLMVLSELISDIMILRLLDLLIGTVVGAAVFCVASLNVLTGDNGLDAMRRMDARRMSVFLMAYALPAVLFTLLGRVGIAVLGDGVGILLFGAALTAGMFLVLARYGTLYPAILISGDVSLSAARGRARTGKVFWRIVGVFLFVSIASVVALLCATLAITVAGLSGGPGAAFVTGAFSRFLNGVVSMGSLVAMAVIFCNAYRGVYADSVP